MIALALLSLLFSFMLLFARAPTQRNANCALSFGFGLRLLDHVPGHLLYNDHDLVKARTRKTTQNQTQDQADRTVQELNPPY